MRQIEPEAAGGALLRILSGDLSASGASAERHAFFLSQRFSEAGEAYLVFLFQCAADGRQSYDDIRNLNRRLFFWTEHPGGCAGHPSLPQWLWGKAPQNASARAAKMTARAGFFVCFGNPYASARPSAMPSSTMPMMTPITQATCPGFSFSFRNTRPRMTETMQ